MDAGPRAAPDAPRVRPLRACGGLIALLLLCAAPHLLRMTLPVTTVADGSYAHAAWMLREGFVPYVQFTQVAFPLAEGALAAVMAVFGHDLRVVELAHLAVVLGVALALRAAARRMVWSTAWRTAESAPTAARARRAGVVAALAWSWCAWVVHFNLFERETWAALGTSLALCALFAATRAETPDTRATAASDGGWRRAWAVGAALALGFCIKLTVIVAAAALLLHLVLCGRVRAALRTAVACVVLVGAATLACWLAWGTPFLQQVYLFGFFRNPNVAGPVEALGRIIAFSDVTLLLGFAALLALGLPSLRRPAGAPALVLLGELGLFACVSPTVWNHNLIDLVPGAALLLGAVAAAWSGALALRMTAALALVLGVAAVLPGGGAEPSSALPSLQMFAPYTEGWSRVGVAHNAAFLQRYSAPDDVVCTRQPAYALQAGRVEFMRYVDLQSLALALDAAVRADGLAATWAQRQGPLLLGPAAAPRVPAANAARAGAASGAGSAGVPAADDPRLARFGPYLGRLVACGIAHDRPLLLDALAQREIALIVEPLPTVILTPGDLSAAGYYRFEDPELGLAGWKPADGVGRRVVRDLFTR